MVSAAVPAERRARNPLLDADAWAALEALAQDSDAPRWNWPIGDRVVAGDLAGIAAFRAALAVPPPDRRRLPPALLAALEAVRRRSPLLAERTADIVDLGAAWATVPTLARADLARHLADLVPPDADLDRLIVYGTSGSTGVPLDLPHHPAAVALHFVLLEAVLAAWGVRPALRRGALACVNVGAQADAAVFATAIAVWDQALFAKVALHPAHWMPAAARAFLARHPPALLTGDPGGLAELLAWELAPRPQAIVSSAAHLDAGLARELTRRCGCPVIDSYATTETGPVAFAHPDGEGMAILPPDLHVEVVDGDGRPLPEGEPGELCISGGRNPYLPLLRYRTGDHARLVTARDGTLRLVDLQGRRPVVLRAADGAAIAPPDVARLVHREPVIAFQCRQRAGVVALALRPVPGATLALARLQRGLDALFGQAVAIHVDPALGADGRKLEPFVVG